MNNKLAIAIPTYNRPDILGENLRKIIPVLKKYSIPVYISDDSGNNETRDMVSGLLSEYEYIFYVKNFPAHGHDLNFFRTIALPNTEYVWYLGDSLMVFPSRLEQIINKIDSGMDFVFVNSGAAQAEGGLIKDVKSFLEKNTWYLTLTGATIYGRAPRVHAARYPDGEPRWTNFPQLGLILDYAEKNETNAFWVSEASFEINKKKKSYWSKNAVKVFARDWISLIDSFKSLFGTARDAVILSHSRKTGFFKIPHLLYLRGNGGLDADTVSHYEGELRRASVTPIWVIRSIVLIPIALLWIIKFIRRACRYGWQRVMQVMRSDNKDVH